MSEQKEAVAKEIAKTSEVIRKKHRALKIGRMSAAEAREMNLQPIVEPLHKLVEKASWTAPPPPPPLWAPQPSRSPSPPSTLETVSMKSQDLSRGVERGQAPPSTLETVSMESQELAREQEVRDAGREEMCLNELASSTHQSTKRGPPGYFPLNRYAPKKRRVNENWESVRGVKRRQDIPSVQNKKRCINELTPSRLKGTKRGPPGYFPLNRYAPKKRRVNVNLESVSRGVKRRQDIPSVQNKKRCINELTTSRPKGTKRGPPGYFPLNRYTPKNRRIDENLEEKKGFKRGQEIPNTLYKKMRTTEDYGPLSREYLNLLFDDTEKQADKVYGVYYDNNNELMIGNSTFDVDKNDNILINNVKYEGTPGLYELIFKKIPSSYENEDLRAYRNILISTSAHKRDRSPLQPVMGNRGYKNRIIIAPLMQREGLVRYPDAYLVEKVLRKKGNKVYVKWLGFDSSHNSWINKNDVL